jgi:hypothetical protein
MFSGRVFAVGCFLSQYDTSNEVPIDVAKLGVDWQYMKRMAHERARRKTGGGEEEEEEG